MRPRKSVPIIVLAALIVLHLILLSTLRLFPLTDLPYHLAVATINRHYDEPANAFAEYYSIDLFPRPNCFHPLFCSLTVFPDVESANRMFYALYAVLLPLAALLIIRKLGGNPWFSLLSLLLLYNLSFRWGFVGFTISVPFVLLAVYFHLRSLGSRSLTDRMFVMLLLAGLYFMHAMAAVLCGLLVAASIAVNYRRSPGRLLKELLVGVPLLGLLLWWISTSPGGQSGTLVLLASYYRHDYLASYPERADLLFIDHRHLYLGVTGKVVGSLFSLSILGMLLAGIAKHRGAMRRLLAGPGAKSILVLLAVSLACYVLLPQRIVGAVSIYRRLSVFILLWMIVLGASLFRARLPRPGKVLILLVCTAHLVLWAGYFRGFQNENRSFDREFFPQDARKKILAGLILDRAYRGAAIYMHFENYFTIWAHGITKSRFSQFRFVNVRPKKPDEWPPFLWRDGFDSAQRANAYATGDFILVRAAPEAQPQGYLRDFALAKRAAKWSLYEKIVEAPSGPESAR